jgi:hypothetical protein
MASIVYCGGCNPQIDRGAIARELETASGVEAAPAGPATQKTVHLSGCARACASDHQLVDAAAGVVVAGEMVDGVPTPAGAIATAIARSLLQRPDKE